MATPQFSSGRQFQADPSTGQILYREPIDGNYTRWTALEPSDYHVPTPTSHNVSSLFQRTFH